MEKAMKLTEIARKTLEAYFRGEEFEPDVKTKRKYNEKKACFVTLAKNSVLRGCIGCLEARQVLWREVIENAINAAFHDPRFIQLKEDELKDIKIEISILTKPKELTFKTSDELLKKIKNNMGLILRKKFCSSTFLPQVWEQIPNKKEFLEHLSMKAGLNKDAWKDAEIWYYTASVEKEN